MSNKKSIFYHVKKLFDGGFFHILFGGSLTKIIAFFSSIVIVRFVSKNDYGLLSYADNIYSYIYLITGIGFDYAVLKYCVSDDASKNKAIFNFSLKIGSVVEIAIIAIAVTISLLFIPKEFANARIYIYSLILYPFLYYWIALSLAFIRARQMAKEYAYAGIIQSVIVFFVSIGLVFFINAFSVIVARYIGAIIVIVYCSKKIIPYFKGCEKITLASDEKRKFIVFGLSLVVANIFSMIMPINENFLVNNIIRDVGISANYKVANLIPQQLTFVTSAIITFYFPKFAKIENKKEIWESSKKVGLFTVLIIAVVAFVGAIVSPLIISLVYGNQYSDINGLMMALWFMHFLNAGLRMLPMNILPAIGHTKFNVVLAFSSCLLHFVIDYVSINYYGINGAVIAGCIVYLLTSCCYWMYLKKVTVGIREEKA